MNVSVVEPALRFDRPSWSLWASRPPFETVYTCPQCSERVGFNTRHFEGLPGRRKTGLSPDVAATFDRLASELRVGDLPSLDRLTRVGFQESDNVELVRRPFVDWTCPTCRSSARVYSAYWGFGHETFLMLLAVMEAPPAPASACAA